MPAAELEPTKSVLLPSLPVASPVKTDIDTSECSSSSTDCDDLVDSHSVSQSYSQTPTRCSRRPKLCLCEVRQHVTETSCWLVANQRVYDATALLRTHPGGARSILRKAGGADCSQDMAFHARSVRKTLDAYLVGRLQRCGGDDDDGNDTRGCSVM